MTLPSVSSDRALSIYLTLAQYPILRVRIRARMRKELFERGVITPREFEREVREKAVKSQAREGLHSPFQEEPANIWEMRLSRVRSHLTDFYFAYNFPHDLFEQIVREELSENGSQVEDMLVSFNPELAPEFMLFEQAQNLEKLEPGDRDRAAARLREIKVVLIRRLISDQLAYINIAKEWFTVADLGEISKRKIGEGKIGGKAAGMLLALRILSEVAEEQVKSCLRIPLSFFIGSDVMYSFMSLNGLLPWGDQKYKPEEQIHADYPQIVQDYLAGDFPIDIIEELKALLDEVGQQPLIVRSSSLLEDSFGTSFAGKYESIFCPNQGSPTQNLSDLTTAIARVYASVLNPDALLYRRSKGLQDYDERMGILIQVVQGEHYGRYYLPHAAGVAFSRNLFRWSPKIRKEDGFVRLVWGLGTRAVERVGNDYPRLVALSHPLLHPESAPKAIRRYSQQYVDLIDLEDNAYKTLPISEVLGSDYPILRYLAEIDYGGYLVPLRSKLLSGETGQLVLTFDEMFRRTHLAEYLRKMLNDLERIFTTAVDTEFTVSFPKPSAPDSDFEIYLLQCRPQSRMVQKEARLPHDIPSEDIIFSTKRMVPQGRVDRIRWVVFVTPEDYFNLPTTTERAKVSQAIGQINTVLGDQTFICVGPGRWGTRNPDLGVYIGYADIYNTRSLVELAGAAIGPVPEPSFGTHFFQDLVEANIYPLTVYLDDDEVDFQRSFFYDTPNQLNDIISSENPLPSCLRLIEVASYRPGHHLDLIMDDERGQAIAFLVQDLEKKTDI